MGGCGDEGAGLRSEQDFALPAQPDPDVRNTVLGIEDGLSVRNAAVEELTRRCMAKQGFRYIKPAVNNVKPTIEMDYGTPLAAAKRQGYGMQARLVSADKKDANNELLKKLPPDKKAQWSTALAGGTGAPIISVDVPEIGSISSSTKGCLPNSRAALYGSVEQ